MKIRFLLLFIPLTLSSCTLINSYSDDLSLNITQWIKEKKYNVALNTIDYINPTHKDYRVIQKQKKIILKKMASYEKAAIKKSSQLANKGYWIKALKLLDEVTENILNTKKIKKHRALILRKRNKIITIFENDILHNQAIHLARNINLYKKINQTVSAEEENLLGVSNFNELRKETSLRLIERSRQQYKSKQYNEALTTINLALKLNPDKDILIFKNKIKKRIKYKGKGKKSSNVKKVNVLLHKLSKGYSHAALKETKETIIWLNKIKGNDKIYLKQLKELKKHLNAGVKKDFETARKLYSQDKIQEALSIWLTLYELDPKYPKLRSYIKRAKKVLRKLKKLSNKPKVVGG